MGNYQWVKRILERRKNDVRTRGWPRKIWKDGVDEDLQRIECNNWRFLAINRLLKFVVVVLFPF
jgi:hypothetical protein